MSRFVVGLDCVVTGVSVAAFVEGAPSPVTRFVRAPRIERGAPATVETARTIVTADSAMESVLRSGIPAFVVMMKPSISKGKDDSAPRRMMLAGEIQRQLIGAGIPFAEVSSMTLVDWLLGAGRKYPPRDFAPLEAAVQDAWRPSAPDDGFRLTTVAVAAAAAVVAGIPTRKAVENSSLAALSEMRLPEGWQLPETASQWNRLYVKSEVA
ncbi:Uncharacterised protein [Mycobacteroides abscessus subsp. abscessus]|nr:Uncharacterised protein [Mycobacteroides abscessus subsp. abscessus]SKN08475.1 Uncharacterised protein [Mycobacteroides abscessus subsp. massiliense]SHP59819.1 Uncharacterised protein [Mycobacteroides abscessus subsp. abscessus]SHP82435.1 Uncharacterised protein [Mycobacteroides abscessus subsp. abscessus]SHP94668.1 Uncharacterised protein [Mycobacteroides abscessus subsp. abscessus]